jgi:hypothetical protein
MSKLLLIITIAAARLEILDPEASRFGPGFSGLFGRVLPTVGLPVTSDEPDVRALGSIDVTLLRGRFGGREEYKTSTTPADAPRTRRFTSRSQRL